MVCQWRVVDPARGLLAEANPLDATTGAAEMKYMQITRILGAGLNLTEARYYGWRWALHVGPWLVFFWPMPEPPK